jgi:hypothetical protein
MTLFKLVITGSLAAGLAWLTLTGYATGPADSATTAKPNFEAVDANQDGLITPTEAEGTWLADAFADVDANQDGIVNRNEYETANS